MDLPVFLTGITFAANAYKAAVELRDEAQIVAATYDLQAQLVIAGAHALDMNAKVLAATDSERAAKANLADAEEKTRQLEKRISDRERYELAEDYPGTFALRLKESGRNGEPLHYLCAACMDNRAVKSIIQFHERTKRYGVCHECKAGFQFQDPEEWPV